MLRNDHEFVVSRHIRRRCHRAIDDIADGIAGFLGGGSVNVDTDEGQFSFLPDRYYAGIYPQYPDDKRTFEGGIAAGSMLGMGVGATRAPLSGEGDLSG